LTKTAAASAVRHPPNPRETVMHGDFLDELLGALDRVGPLDHERLKAVLILGGWPEQTQSLRYLADNHQRIHEEAGLVFSAVAVINNSRVVQWRLEGWRRWLNRLVVYPIETKRPPGDRLLHRLRRDAAITGLMAASRKSYTLFGMLRIEPAQPMAATCEIRPVIALPGLNVGELAQVKKFEAENRLFT
jgi:hypothetical protein